MTTDSVQSMDIPSQISTDDLSDGLANKLAEYNLPFDSDDEVIKHEAKPCRKSSKELTHIPRAVAHFDLPFDDNDSSEDVQRVKSCPRRKGPKEPPYRPRAVFGLYMPRELVYDIGWYYKPDWAHKDRENLTEAELSYLRGRGTQFSSAYCQEMFPDIPLRWKHSIMAYAGDPMGLHPILVLGHMDSKKNIILDVTLEDMEHMQEELGLVDQEPYWYSILYMR